MSIDNIYQKTHINGMSILDAVKVIQDSGFIRQDHKKIKIRSQVDESSMEMH